MAVSLKERQNIDELAGILYEMLPGSGNPRLSFPTVADSLGLLETAVQKSATVAA